MIHYFYLYIEFIRIYWLYTAYIGGFSGGSIAFIYWLINIYKNGYNLNIVFNLGNVNINSSVLIFILYSSSFGAAFLPIIFPSLITFIYKRIKFNPQRIAKQLYVNRVIPITNFIQNNIDDCPICMNKIELEDKPLSCGHFIHRICFINTNKTTCPVCIQEVYMTESELIEYVKRNRNNYIN
jgi:hypothetical protein